MNELQDLIDAYNANEALQSERLSQIYRLFIQRKGYKCIRFGSVHSWNNLIANEVLELPRLLADLVHPITECIPGSE